MLKRIIPFTLSLFITLFLMAQVPRTVRIESPIGHNTTLTGKRAPCPGQSAGNIFLGPVNGMSNSIPAPGEVTYLCFGDRFDLTHNGDFTFANPTTNPGVGYAFYNFDCIPSVDGPDIATVLGDCLFGNPNRAEELLIFVDLNDPASGNATFQNIVNPELGQSLPDFFNGGDPIQFWFAPITYDNLDNDTVKYEGVPVSGPCVSVSVDQAFSVVYLNPIEVLNENFPFGGNPCEARLTLKGGLPEFDPTENYNIIVRNVADPTITGEVSGGPFGNRDLPVISVTQAGTYDIIISDGKSCEVVHRIDMGSCVSNDIIFETVGGTFSLGQEVCVDVTVKDFADIVSFFFSLNWDTSFLTFERLDFTDAFLRGSDVNIINDPLGFGSVLFQDPGFNGNTLPDDSKLFSICFIAQKEGDTDVNFTNAPGFPGNGAPIEILTTDIDGNIGEVNLNPIEGTITIVDPNRLNTSITTIRNACPGDNNGSFDISIVGGNAPYEITITWDFNGGGTDGPLPLANEGDVGTFSNLQPGKYEIFTKEVGPINPRFSRDSIEIVEANIAVNATTISSPICNGDDNGVMKCRSSLGWSGTYQPGGIYFYMGKYLWRYYFYSTNSQ